LSQGWWSKSQCWDWAHCIVSNLPGQRGRHCVLWAKEIKSGSRLEEEMSDLRINHITSKDGWKSGINSIQNKCTGSLKMWSWNSCHQELKVGWATVVGIKGQV
jgi:hypothetical protein